MSDIKDLEKTLWATADKLRSNMDAAEYKHVVLGLIFLKYISDAFNDLHSKLVKGEGEFEGADPEDADEYVAYNVFFVPETARWKYLQDRAKQPEIGKLIDNAMDEIEKINSNLKGVLPKIYADPELNKTRLGELIDLIGTIGFNQDGHTAKDLLGQVYEYFLGQFADAEGKKGGQFYTPSSIVKLLVEMLEPYEGRVYDGACGSGGMFVQSEKFVSEHQGNIKNLSIYGQESNPTTLRLAKMNLAIRGIDAKIELGDTFMDDKHKDLKADYILANPPFNISDWSGEQLRDDYRWKYGLPPVGNANYAWLQHFISKLSNSGTAGIVLANGSMNSNTGNEGEIRKNMIEAGLIDCMVSLPAQLFYNTAIPACLWFLAKNKSNGKYRNRSNEILFIDARNLGVMVNRRNKEFTNDDIKQISLTYHNWRNINGKYEDIAGFCKSTSIEDVKNNSWILLPGRYVGTEEAEIDGTPFEEKILSLTIKLSEQFNQNAALEKSIRENLKVSDMSSNQSEIVSLHDITLSANTGLDAIKRAPIVEFDSGIKCLRIQDISQSKKFEDWGFCEVNEKNFLSFQLKQNDIIIARTGETVGVNKIILSDLKSVFNNGLIRLRINPKKINPFYLFYNLQNIDFKNHINGVARGASTQPNLRIEALLDFKINLPTIDIQNKIAKILSSLDSKIELNWQTIKTLRELSKSLFLEICVPKNAEELQDNWVVSKLSEFVEIKNGYAFKGTDFIDNGIPVIKIKNVKAGRVILNNLSYVSREVADKAKRFLIKQNELLITMSGNRHDGNPETWVGKVGIFHRDGEYLLNQRVSILNIIDENKMSRYFLSELLSSEEFQSYFISNATSSGGQANISPDLIYNTEIIVPPIEQLHKFNKLAKEIYNKIFANELEVETLTTLRDTLLPRLIKGEIEI